MCPGQGRTQEEKKLRLKIDNKKSKQFKITAKNNQQLSQHGQNRVMNNKIFQHQ